MKVIVSTELADTYTNFVVMKSFKEVRDLKENTVDTLIIHKPQEDQFNSGVFMAEFHNIGITQFVYINKEPSTTIKMLVNGLKGTVIEDEFYLEDEEELLALLEDIGTTPQEDTSVAVSSIKLVSDFMEAFVRGEERIKAPVYLEQVNHALTELQSVNQQQELAIKEMGTTSIEVFEKASNIIRNMDNQRKLIQEQLDKLEESQFNSNSNGGNRVSLGNSVQFFSPIKYTGNAKILFIREYSHCRYLTSFALAYTHHVHYTLNKRVKLIICHQKGAGISKLYEEMFTSLDENSSKMISLYDNEYIATNNPKKEVMRELLSKPCDLFVVVDRLYGREDILEGRITAKINACGGLGDIKRYNLKIENTIFPVIEQKGNLFFLPSVKDYVTQIDARFATYETVHEKNFAILDNKTGIVPRN